MTYGISVKNSSGRTIIDSTEGGAFLFCNSHGTASASTGAGTGGASGGTSNTFPAVNYSGGNLIIARPNLTAATYANTRHRISIQTNGTWGRSQNGFPTTAEGGVVWRELLSQKQAGITPSSYGLVVYDGAGTASSNILFSATDLAVTAELVAIGTFTGTTQRLRTNGKIAQFYTGVTMTESDKSRYYALVNGTNSDRTANARRQISLEFDYANNQIRAINYSRPTGTGTNQVDVSALSYNKDWAVFYVRNGEGTIATDGTY